MEINDKAYEFCLKDYNEQEHCLKNFSGKWIVLYFYPKDNTSGCTKEATDFTEQKNDFEKNNAVIIGISPDKPESHSKFIKKYNLGIILLSDTQKEIMKKYGAWGLKKNYGKEYEGVIRSTFIINPDLKIAYKWHNVKVRQKRKSGTIKHSQIVLNKLLELQNQYNK
jgi:peroxiredoxin Q/BCP